MKKAGLITHLNTTQRAILATVICLSRWTGYTEVRIREDCALATQWTGERFLLEYCCGPQSRIGDPENFVDNSCKVIRYTEKKDMRTDEGLKIALNDIA
eukprot:5645744-Pyramimonas_sp.AAC.1